MDRSYLLFDLDGTLTDSAPGITRSAAYALGKYGIRARPEELTFFVGPPLYGSFMEHYGFSREKADEAVAYFREYFTTRGMFENAPYPGVPEMLETLRASGYSLIVATSKPTVFAKKILCHFDLEKYFSFTLGCELDGRRINKGEVIGEILETLSIPIGSAVMVGDREHDVIGAKKVGLPAIGVLYGYGSREELAQAGAAALAERPEDIPSLLSSLSL